MSKAASSKYFRYFPLLLLLAGSFVITLCALYLLSWYLATHGTDQPPISSNTVNYSTVKPNETKPAGDYVVAADQPRQIKIPKITAEGYIQKVGKDQNNSIAVPTNIHFAGWYVGSVRPGEKGLSIIDGHLGGRYSPGIFSKLNNLTKGDQITVEFGDKSIRQFVIVEKKTVKLAQSAAVLFEKKQNIERQLNLITCDGNYVQSSKTYDNRLIIISKALNDEAENSIE